MYAFILFIWTATTGSTAYAMREIEIGKYQSVEDCNESARKQKSVQFECQQVK